MITLFRINDPYRLILVFLVILLIRLPFYIQGIDLTIPELRWMLVGERLNDGFTLYDEVYDDIGPLSAIIYEGIDLIFGRSHAVILVLGCLLAFIQAAIFNSFLLANKSYRENTYVPALMYGLFICYSFDFLLLSPQLMSLTFILLALNNIFKRIDNKTRDELFLFTGIYLGIAVLFYFPTWIVFITFLVILIVFSNALPRRLILMALGFFMIVGVAAIYYYMIDSLDSFMLHFVYSHWKVDQVDYSDGNSLIYLLIFPAVFTVLAFIKIYGSNKFVNFQLKFQQAMLFLAIGASFILINANESSTLLLIYLMPSAAFYAAHFLLLIKKPIWLHIGTVVIFFLVISISYSAYQPNPQVSQFVNFEKYFLDQNPPEILSDKKVLVLGPEISYYLNSTPAQPYINWQLSKKQLEELDYYDNAVKVLKNFNSDLPEIIIDQQSLLPTIFERIPLLSVRYVPIPSYPGYYRLISN